MGRWNFGTTNGSGINVCIPSKNFLEGKLFIFATTGSFDFTKLVEPMPNNALSISAVFCDKILLLYPLIYSSNQ